MPGEATIVTLSRPCVAPTPSTVPSCTPGFCDGGVPAAQARTISAAAARNCSQVEPHRRGRHHAEIRQHGVAAADRRVAVEDVAEVVALGDLLHVRAGVGDGDEMLRRPCPRRPPSAWRRRNTPSGCSAPACRRTCWTRCTAWSPASTFFSNAAICCGSVLSSTCSVGEAAALAERLGQHFRPEAGAAHAEQQHVGEAGLPSPRPGTPAAACRSAMPVIDDVEPGEPLGLVLAGPQRGVARPQLRAPCRPRASRPGLRRPPCPCLRQA